MKYKSFYWNFFSVPMRKSVIKRLGKNKAKQIMWDGKREYHSLIERAPELGKSNPFAMNIRETHPVIFETAIICATVGLMCPAMSFIAAWLYYPYYAGFNLITLLANWLKLVCFNFPFAFFTQLFFIQPFVRTVFKLLFRKDIAARKQEW